MSVISILQISSGAAGGLAMYVCDSEKYSAELNSLYWAYSMGPYRSPLSRVVVVVVVVDIDAQAARDSTANDIW